MSELEIPGHRKTHRIQHLKKNSYELYILALFGDFVNAAVYRIMNAMRNHYFKTRVTKMGKWNTPPLDTGTWYGENTNEFFKQTFGIPKGILTMYTGEDGYMHAYVPTKYFTLLHKQIVQINQNDYLALSRKLRTFYSLDEKAKAAVRGIYKNPHKLSNAGLAKSIEEIRRWVHHVVVFDQFGWLGEEYWTPLMKNILQKEAGLNFGSKEYNEVMFALIKPEQISTTLTEKRAVLFQAIKIKNKKTSFLAASKILAQQFGWMPIFTYGDGWQAEHYTQGLKDLTKSKLKDLIKELEELKYYRIIRNRDISKIVKKYRLGKKSLQIFIDFGLALDVRNEAEYFVSYAGKFLMPLFNESQARLYLSSKQLRGLTEKELVDALRGKQFIENIQAKKGKYGGWGYDLGMKKRLNLNPIEAENLFKHIESYVKPIQGGDESKGTCASPGKVRGKIRIVAFSGQNDKVRNGDVMVTYATCVDHLRAMKRAAAIVTEVGGLTCHAAVVSREFGIPCVVALKNAMTNFKDGELVEVDANKGIVRKL